MAKIINATYSRDTRREIPIISTVLSRGKQRVRFMGHIDVSNCGTAAIHNIAIESGRWDYSFSMLYQYLMETGGIHGQPRAARWIKECGYIRFSYANGDNEGYATGRWAEWLAEHHPKQIWRSPMCGNPNSEALIRECVFFLKEVEEED